MKKENWRPVVGYEGLYEVSDLGNVRSLKRNKVLSPILDKDGYYIVNLHKDGKQKTYKIHRLVAEAFIPNPDNKPQINHKSEIKTQNTVWVNEDGTIDLDKSNLEWTTAKENTNWGTGIERCHQKRCKQIKQMDLENHVIKIWPSVNEAGRNGFNIGNISACCLGKRKTTGGYQWSYL